MINAGVNIELQRVRDSLNAIEEVINSFGSKDKERENILMKDSCLFDTKSIPVREIRCFQDEIEMLPEDADDLTQYGLCIIPQPNGLTLLVGNKVLNYSVNDKEMLKFFKKSLINQLMKGGEADDGLQR